MEMSGQLHVLAALPPEKRAPGTHSLFLNLIQKIIFSPFLLKV
jgi:hypothetical protein